jgi:NitT/TauT family transport system substrate-binding protein
MSKSKKVTALMLATVIGTTVLTGCSSKKDKAQDDDDYAITVGYYNCDHMTAAPVGVKAGIYEELGLNVKTLGNGKVPEAMAAGQMDAGYISTQGLAGAVTKGSPIVIAANNHSEGSNYLIVANDIKEPKDLLGKTIGANPDTNLLWKTDYGPETGLPADSSKYDCVDMESDKDAYIAFKTGKIKAFSACDPWGSVAEFEGTGKIIASSKYHSESTGNEYNCCSFSLNKNFIKDHPELAKKLVLAHTKSIEYIYTNPIKSAKIFAEDYNVDEEVALMTIYKKTVGEGRTITWNITGNEYKNNLETYKEYKSLDEVPTYDQIVDKTLLESSGADDFDKFIKEKVEPVFPEGMSYTDWKVKATELDKQ